MIMTDPSDHPAPLRILLLWGRWMPYHHARLRGLRAELGAGGVVIPVQYCRSSRDYAWSAQGDAGDGVITLRHSSNESHFSLRAVLGELLPLLQRERPDVVFVPSYWHWSLAAAMLARMVGASVVMMNESHEATVRPGLLRSVVRRLIMPLYSSALVGGQPHKRYFASLGLPPTRIVTGYDAVDNAYFASRATAARLDAPLVRHRLGLPQRYYLWAGRMEPKKNLPLLIEAYARAASEIGPDTPALLLVGGGSQLDAVVTQAHDLGLPIHTAPTPGSDGPCVHLRSFLPPDGLASVYALARCVVLCSRMEEWGLVVNEALAAGTPVVVSQAAGCAEDLLPGPDDPAFPDLHVRRGGLLFDPEDASMLANCLIFLHNNGSTHARLAREAPVAVAPFSPRHFGRAALTAARLALA